MAAPRADGRDHPLPAAIPPATSGSRVSGQGAAAGGLAGGIGAEESGVDRVCVFGESAVDGEVHIAQDDEDEGGWEGGLGAGSSGAGAQGVGETGGVGAGDHGAV